MGIGMAKPALRTQPGLGQPTVVIRRRLISAAIKPACAGDESVHAPSEHDHLRQHTRLQSDDRDRRQFPTLKFDK
ncbi:MAG: hypothetical protein CMN97_03345 [Synechococcus sp. NAT40]|nr:hypothetical protein [Synechococcus sp. NAT40]